MVVVDRDEDRGEATAAELVASGAVAEFHQVDVTIESEVVTLVADLAARHGRVDVLVNSAGTTVPAAPLWETPTDVVEKMWRIHHFAPYLFCREVVPTMIAKGYGRVVNVTSVAGKEGNAGSSAYSSAKAGTIAMTKSLGKELATRGVLVNAVTPGVIDTPLIAAASPDHIAGLLEKIPMKRAGTPEEVAELVFWLSSPRCGFSTGAVFDASGGRTSY